MKKLREFVDQTEAIFARDFLQSQGIPTELHGSRDYSTHIVGGTQGRYVLSVSEDRWDEAHGLLRESTIQIASETDHLRQLPEVALKKAVMFSIIAMVLLPILANWISIRETIKFAKLEKPSRRKWIWIFVISWMQVPGVLIGVTLIRTVLGGSILGFAN